MPLGTERDGATEGANHGERCQVKSGHMLLHAAVQRTGVIGGEIKRTNGADTMGAGPLLHGIISMTVLGIREVGRIWVKGTGSQLDGLTAFLTGSRELSSAALWVPAWATH